MFSKLTRGNDERGVSFADRGVTCGARLAPVRIAVAGAGNYSHHHLKVLAALTNVTLVGISNRGRSDIESVARQYGVNAAFTNYEQMLDSTRPDGVFVVVSHFETARVATSCLERGIPCLIEKPAGFASAETASLAKLAADHQCLNIVGVNRRYWSILHNALTLILQHGPLFGILIDAPEPIRRRRAESALDPRLFDLWMVANTIHAIDLFRCLGGEVTEVQSLKTSWTEASGDSFTAVLRISRDCLGTFISHYNSGGEWSVTLYGDRLKAVIWLGSMKGHVYFDRGRTIPVPVDAVDLNYRAGLYAQDRAFIHALASGEKLTYPASDLEDATKTMRLIEQIGGLV
jgi:predicted dehydrogenase